MFEHIRRAVEVLRRHPDSSEGQIVTALVEAGFDEALAVRMVEFIPLAYSRVWLAGRGVEFSDCYLRMNADGETYTEYKLEDEHVYREAVATAQSELDAGSGFDELFPIFGRSAELKAINNALNGGSKLEDMALSPPVFL
jgi:hypothetical protein